VLVEKEPSTAYTIKYNVIGKWLRKRIRIGRFRTNPHLRACVRSCNGHESGTHTPGGSPDKESRVEETSFLFFLISLTLNLVSFRCFSFTHTHTLSLSLSRSLSKKLRKNKNCKKKMENKKTEEEEAGEKMMY